MTVAATAIIHPHVHLGEAAQVEDYVVLGVVPRAGTDQELETHIGRSATIRSHTVIYAGNRIGDGFQTGHHVLIREANRIGDQVSIGSGSRIEHHVTIASRVRLHSNVFVPEYTVLEEGCWLGPGVVLTNCLHPLCPQAKRCLKGPRIGAGAIIGAHATILPSLIIGERALVGAGAVVTRDVEPGMVVVGPQAAPLKRMDELTCQYGLMDHPYPGLKT